MTVRNPTLAGRLNVSDSDGARGTEDHTMHDTDDTDRLHRVTFPREWPAGRVRGASTPGPEKIIVDDEMAGHKPAVLVTAENDEVGVQVRGANESVKASLVAWLGPRDARRLAQDLVHAAEAAEGSS
jgi:hypothetical protein